MSQLSKVGKISDAMVEEIIKLAWADTVPFETIKIEYGLTENQVRAFMRKHQPEKTYIRWRERVEARAGTGSKHQVLSTKTSARMKY
jgi:uncharacterized protein (TIGR03643 family)